MAPLSTAERLEFVKLGFVTEIEDVLRAHAEAEEKIAGIKDLWSGLKALWRSGSSTAGRGAAAASGAVEGAVGSGAAAAGRGMDAMGDAASAAARDAQYGVGAAAGRGMDAMGDAASAAARDVQYGVGAAADAARQTGGRFKEWAKGLGAQPELAGAATGAGIGAFGGPIGAGIGAGVGFLGGGLGRLMSRGGGPRVAAYAKELFDTGRFGNDFEAALAAAQKALPQSGTLGQMAKGTAGLVGGAAGLGALGAYGVGKAGLEVARDTMSGGQTRGQDMGLGDVIKGLLGAGAGYYGGKALGGLVDLPPEVQQILPWLTMAGGGAAGLGAF